MPLNQKSIDRLKKIHFEEFGEMLSDKDAWDMGIRLINIFKSLHNGPDLSTTEQNPHLTGKQKER